MADLLAPAELDGLRRLLHALAEATDLRSSLPNAAWSNTPGRRCDVEVV